MSRPTVSVIMAVRNAERFLRDALDSIAAQTFGDFEVIVVDGASDDDSTAIARSYPKTIRIAQQGTGLAAAWNAGIAAARGPFIAFLDSDDLWDRQTLAVQLEVFEREPEVEYAFGRIQFFVEPGQPLPRGFRPELLKTSHLAPTPGASMIRRTAVDRIGPFDETMRVASDIAWFAALRDTSITRAVSKVLLRKRLHDLSLGQSTPWTIFKSELLQIARHRAVRGRAAPNPPGAGT